MNAKYTDEQIGDAVWSTAYSQPYETLVEFYANDLYEFYRRSATEQELEDFMQDNWEGNQ